MMSQLTNNTFMGKFYLFFSSLDAFYGNLYFNPGTVIMVISAILTISLQTLNPKKMNTS